MWELLHTWSQRVPRTYSSESICVITSVKNDEGSYPNPWSWFAPSSWNGMTTYVPINGQIWLPFEHAQKYIPGCRWFK